jgi:cytoplasmic iron level regulating protein YaaA (DUF328/UPF0246 family)
MADRFLILLSPAKNLASRPISKGSSTQPMFPDEANRIAQTLKAYSLSDLGHLMKLSAKLAQLNYDRFQSFNSTALHNKNTSSALFTFNGQAFATLDAASLNDEALDYLQNHLYILSGLYGFLRPYDDIQPYRLEMSTSLKVDGHANLYEFWKEKLTDKLNHIIQKDGITQVINCASEEYSRAIHFKDLLAPVITCQFQDFKNEEYKNIGIYAKKARGLMVRYLAQNNAVSLKTIQTFNSLGYVFSKEASTDDHYIFLRKD